MDRLLPVKSIVTAARVILLAGVLPLPCLPAQCAEQILQSARMSPTAKPASLRAQIRGEGPLTPLRIELKDRVISYTFTDPDQTLLLELDPIQTQLLEKKGGTAKAVTGTHLHDEVRDTGVTYQDLSLGFLYWPRPVLHGVDSVKTRSAWKIDLQAPADEPLYGVARVWVDTESGAILRIEGYDKKGLLMRRFEIISAQKIEGLWMLKQMRIEGFEPGKPDPVSRCYLEVLGKE